MPLDGHAYRPFSGHAYRLGEGPTGELEVVRLGERPTGELEVVDDTEGGHVVQQPEEMEYANFALSSRREWAEMIGGWAVLAQSWIASCPSSRLQHFSEQADALVGDCICLISAWDSLDDDGEVPATAAQLSDCHSIGVKMDDLKAQWVAVSAPQQTVSLPAPDPVVDIDDDDDDDMLQDKPEEPEPEEPEALSQALALSQMFDLMNDGQMSQTSSSTPSSPSSPSASRPLLVKARGRAKAKSKGKAKANTKPKSKPSKVKKPKKAT